MPDGLSEDWTVAFTIEGLTVTNPSSNEPTSTFHISTYSNSELIDESTSFTYTAEPGILTLPTDSILPDDSITGMETTYTIKFQPPNNVE